MAVGATPEREHDMRTWLTSLLVICGATLSAGAQQVHVVDAGGAGDFTAIQPAVDAAAAGDVLLIRGGSYAGATLSGKPLALIAEPDSTVEVLTQIFIEGLPANTVCLLSGIDVHGGDGASEPALLAEACAGTLWLQSCEFRGSHATPGFADDGAIFDACADVVLLRSDFRGGNKGAFPHHQGRPGLRAVGSRLWAFESGFFGTAGGFNDDIGGNGGSGASIREGSELFSAYGEFRGANGGGADDDYSMSCECVMCGYAGPGGNGLDASVDSHVTLHGAQLSAGEGGHSSSAKGCPDGPDGQPLQLSFGSTSTLLGGQPRGLRVTPVVLENGAFEVTFFGAPGEIAWLIAGLDVRPSWLAGKLAPLLVQVPFVVAKPFGVVPVAGFKHLELQMPALPDGLDGLLITTQAYFSASGQLSNGTTTLVLDESF